MGINLQIPWRLAAENIYGALIIFFVLEARRPCSFPAKVSHFLPVWRFPSAIIPLSPALWLFHWPPGTTTAVWQGRWGADPRFSSGGQTKIQGKDGVANFNVSITPRLFAWFWTNLEVRGPVPLVFADLGPTPLIKAWPHRGHWRSRFCIADCVAPVHSNGEGVTTPRVHEASYTLGSNGQRNADLNGARSHSVACCVMCCFVLAV